MPVFAEPSLSVAGGELKLVLSAEWQDSHASIQDAQTLFEVFSRYLQPAKGFSGTR